MNHQPITSSNSRQYLIHTFLVSPYSKATQILFSIIFRPLPQGQTQPEVHDIVDRISFFIYSISNHPDEFALKLSNIIHSSAETPIIRNVVLIFLYSLFSFQNSPLLLFSGETCTELKPILLSLLQQETSMAVFNVLSRMVSILFSHMFQVKDFNQDWVELLDYIRSLFSKNVQKGLLVFRDLPVNMKGPLFTKSYRHEFQRVISKHLENTEDEELWVLAFGASITMALILISCERKYLVESIMDGIMKSVTQLFMNGKQVCVRKGFESIDYIVDKECWKYSLQQAAFVIDLADGVYRFRGVTDETKNAVRKFSNILPLNQGGSYP